MKNFCTKCGKPIEQCTCGGSVQSDVYSDSDLFGGGFQFDLDKIMQDSAPARPKVTPAAQPTAAASSQRTNPAQPRPNPAQPRTNPAQPKPNPAPQPRAAQSQTRANPAQTRQGSFCTRCGKPLVECTCGKTRVPPTRPSSGGTEKDRMTLKDFLGFYESDNHMDRDFLEHKKRIVPDVLELCEGEVPIRQYKIGKARRRSTLSWGYSRIQVTNKRLIQRTVGRSFIGKDVAHTELAIDDITGISYTRGKQFSFGDFRIMLYLIALVGLIGFGIGQIGEAIPYIITILVFLGVGYFRLFRKLSFNGPYALANALAVGTWMGSFDPDDILEVIVGFDSGWFGAVLCAVTLIVTIIYWIRYALLPSITLTARTRSLNHGAEGMMSLKRLAKITMPSVILPTEETEQAVRELNAIITDVQKMGDYAVEKWADQPQSGKKY